ncbi:MLO-like protein 4 [Nymphaea thermarum]|nr:MLO-like protein 4 [Nymphaea thermarum]
MAEGRSLAETPTWSVATVTTVMVAVCFIVERSIYRFGKWLKKTKRKALLASLDKIKEELMLLGLISLMLGQWARWISEICVKSSLFSSRFYPCTRDDTERLTILTYINQTAMPLEKFSISSNHCSENHRLPLSYNFHKYMVRSMEDEFQGIVGISWPLWIYAIVCIFINIHGLNVYFWLSFVPALLILLVGTKLQHVVAKLALEVVETTGPLTGTQLKPRDELFWFGKPELLLWLIQFISFQNAFEMATFLWSVVS